MAPFDTLTTIPVIFRADLQYGMTWYQTLYATRAELRDIETWRLGLADDRTVYVERTTDGLTWPVIRVGVLDPRWARMDRPQTGLTAGIMATAISQHGARLARLAYHLREDRHNGRDVRELDDPYSPWEVPAFYESVSPVALACTTLAPVADVSIIEQSGKDRQAEAVNRILPGCGHDDARRLVRALRDLSTIVEPECIRW